MTASRTGATRSGISRSRVVLMTTAAVFIPRPSQRQKNPLPLGAGSRGGAPARGLGPRLHRRRSRRAVPPGAGAQRTQGFLLAPQSANKLRRWGRAPWQKRPRGPGAARRFALWNLGPPRAALALGLPRIVVSPTR